MIVISRKPGETLMIGDKIRVRVVRIRGKRVDIAVEAEGRIDRVPHRSGGKPPVQK